MRTPDCYPAGSDTKDAPWNRAEAPRCEKCDEIMAEDRHGEAYCANPECKENPDYDPLMGSVRVETEGDPVNPEED